MSFLCDYDSNSKISYTEFGQINTSFPLKSSQAFVDACQFLNEWYSNKTEFTFSTSGSTGNPKEITFNREQIMAAALASINALHLTKSDFFLNTLSISRIASIMAIIRAQLIQAPMCIAVPHADVLSQIPDAHPFTVVSLVPNQLPIKFDENMRAKLNRFQTILIGGSSMGDAMIKELSLLNTNVYQTYGMTETLSHIALRKINQDRFLYPLPGIGIRLSDKNNLEIQAPYLSLDWIQTHDEAIIHSDGGFEILGRSDDVIISGAHKIPSVKIEQTLNNYWKQWQATCFMVATPDEKLGAVAVVLVYVNNPDYMIDIEKSFLELLTNKNLNIHPFDYPKKLHFIRRIIYNAGGKPDKPAMLALLNRV